MPYVSENTYSTGEIMIACDVTSRQLQWWDEKNVVLPRHMGHHREYTEIQAVEVALVVHMRRRGICLETVRRILKVWRRREAEDRARFLIVSRDGRKIQLAETEADVVKLTRSGHSAWLIDTEEQGRIARATLAQGLQHPNSGRRYADPIGRTGFPTKGAGSSRLPGC